MKTSKSATTNDDLSAGFVATVEPGGRITIPGALCERLGWQEGTMLQVGLVEDGDTGLLAIVLQDAPDATDRAATDRP